MWVTKGSPENWESVICGPARDSFIREMIEAPLPQLSFPDYFDPIIDFTHSPSDHRPSTPDSQLENDQEAVILQAQRATVPVTQRLLDLQPTSSLKIITTNCSSYPPPSSSLLTASEGSCSAALALLVPV